MEIIILVRAGISWPKKRVAAKGTLFGGRHFFPFAFRPNAFSVYVSKAWALPSGSEILESAGIVSICQLVKST